MGTRPVAVNRSNFSGRKVEPFDRIAGIEWNAVEFYRICYMARSHRSLRQVATLRHGHMARRSDYVKKFSIRVVSIPFKNLVFRPED